MMDPDFVPTRRNFAWVALFNLVVVGIVLFGRGLVGIDDAPLVSRVAFYGMGGLLLLVGMATLVAYVVAFRRVGRDARG